MPATTSPRKINLARRVANMPLYSPLKVVRPISESVRALRIAIANSIESVEESFVLAHDHSDETVEVFGQAKAFRTSISACATFVPPADHLDDLALGVVNQAKVFGMSISRIEDKVQSTVEISKTSLTCPGDDSREQQLNVGKDQNVFKP